jgi:hypothetical protein
VSAGWRSSVSGTDKPVALDADVLVTDGSRSKLTMDAST